VSVAAAKKRGEAERAHKSARWFASPPPREKGDAARDRGAQEGTPLGKRVDSKAARLAAEAQTASDARDWTRALSLLSEALELSGVDAQAAINLLYARSKVKVLLDDLDGAGADTDKAIVCG
jgi:hypothetical protein